ncbi:FkbM family methyltransferase [Nitrosomonas sp.]|uniref:FkbM family methyltransferase n=1 Tax=Nitrosomonas sp. TaxID=42353 RepID=UPI0035B2FE47
MKQAKLFTQQSLLVDDADSLGLIANGIFEPEETRSILNLIRPGDRFLDIGANVGYYTVLAAERVGSAGRVFAVEPDDANFAILDANTRVWQQEGRVEIYRQALSDTTGASQLFLNAYNSGMHRLYSSVVCTGEAIPVSVIRGDDLQLAPLDLIKIDIEGLEPRALRGLQKTLEKSPGVKILSEFSPFSILEAGESPLNWLRWMIAQGFEILALQQGRWSRSACAGLLDSVTRIEQLDFSALIQSLRGLDNQAILEQVIQTGINAGYNRPVLENLFFVRQADVAAIENLLN